MVLRNAQVPAGHRAHPYRKGGAPSAALRRSWPAFRAASTPFMATCSTAISPSADTAVWSARAESVLARHTDRLVAVGAQVRDDLLAAGVGTRTSTSWCLREPSLGPLPDRRAARRRTGRAADAPVVAYVGG